MKLEFSLDDKIRILDWWRILERTYDYIYSVDEDDINLSLKIGEMLRQEEENKR